MMANFVSTAVDRLILPDGTWLDVRRELSGMEHRRVQAAAFPCLTQQGAVDIDMAQMSLARTKAYLVDWNLTDAEDKPVKCTHAAIDSLTETRLKQIEDALDEHIKAHETTEAR